MSSAQETQHVIIVGAGLMGTGIAHAFAVAGCRVILVDIAARALETAARKIDEILAEGVRRSKLSEAEARQASERISTLMGLEAALRSNQPALLLETAAESLAIKTEILKRADLLLADQALIATNTSALSVTEIAAVTRKPERVVGMHFFNPVHKMKLIEIVRGVATSDEAIAQARSWAKKLGKTSIVVNEAPGLATSRMSALLGNEAMYMLMEGTASAEDIDTAMRLGFNHPMGPLELGDLTGWDTRLAVLQYLHQTLGEKFRPCPLIVKLVKSGRVGVKAGCGVYEYVDGVRVPGSGPKVR